MKDLALNFIMAAAGIVYLYRYLHLPPKFRNFEAFVCGMIAIIMVMVGFMAIPEIICDMITKS